jgi:hypothetical protein
MDEKSEPNDVSSPVAKRYKGIGTLYLIIFISFQSEYIHL